jgi:hypothetical protein
MTRTIAITIVALVAGCGEPGIVEQMCQRADECNALPSSVSECQEYLNRCTEDLLPSQREEWEYEIQQCLDRPTCDGAFDCYFEVPWC